MTRSTIPRILVPYNGTNRRERRYSLSTDFHRIGVAGPGFGFGLNWPAAVGRAVFKMLADGGVRQEFAPFLWPEKSKPPAS